MIRFLGLIALVLLSTYSSWGQNKDTASVRITNYKLTPGTYSWRTGENANKFHDMTSWNSSPYTEGHLQQKSGSNWEFRMNYRLLYPGAYEDNPDYSPGYPLIVMLHGAGESANCWNTCLCVDANGNPCASDGTPVPGTSDQFLNNDLNLAHGGKDHWDAVDAAGNKLPNDPSLNSKGFPGFVLFPQMERGWVNGTYQNAIRIIRLLTKQLNIDQNRIYIHGLSNGGQGVMNTVRTADWLFAAAAPMSAISSYTSFRDEAAADSLSHISFWFFQGGTDTNPPPSYTEGSIRIMREAGISVRYTLYPTVGHGVWGKAYDEPDFFSWLLSKNLSDIHVYYDNATICGTTGAGAKLGLAQGFPAYQWERDGELISGANGHIYIATVPGTYRARFSRVINPSEEQWNQWSKPVEVTEAIPPKAKIEVIGSTHLRGPGLINADPNTTVVLRSDQPYAKYSWYKNGTLVNTSQTQDYSIKSNASSANGAYSLVRSGFDNCPSPESDPVYLFFGNTAPTNLLPPQNFQGSALSASSILLTWNDNSNLERAYEIWRRKPGENFTFVKRTNEDDISFVDTQLQPLTLYEYKIRALSNEGRSPYSPSDDVDINLQVTTLEDNERPQTPQNLTAVQSGIRKITLTWQAPPDSDIERYYLYYGSDSLAINAPVTSHVLSNLPLNAVFNYTLKAMDDAGILSNSSNQATANTYVTGLYYKHNTGDWNNLSEMEATWANPEFTGTVSNFTLTPKIQDNFFNFEFEGYLYISIADTYEFRTNSDDGSQLRLNNNLIVDNDGLHGPQYRYSTPQFLSVGAYPINVRFFEKNGGESLSVQYRRSGNANWVNIPNSALQSGAPPVVTPPAAPTNLTAQSAGMTQIDLDWQYSGGNPAGLKVVVLGSSTAVGTGATAGNGWVNRLTNWLSETTTGSSVTNLALGGFSSEDVMPNGDATRNITYALSLNPNVIIVNLPTNDVAEGIPLTTTMANFSAIKALADERGIPMFFTTSQPRNFGQEADQTRRDLLDTTADEIRAAFGNYVIDIYDGLTNFADRKLIKSEFNADGTHVNDAGHQYIFERAQAKLMTYLTNFEVQRGLSVGGPFSLVARTTSTTFNDTGLTPQTPYYYRVRTVNMNGTSPYTAVATATTGTDTEDPTQPLNLTYTGVTLSNVSLKWEVSTDNVGVTGYQIWANGSQIGTSTVPAYQASNLTPGTLYSFYVVAYDAVGNTSVPSAALEVSTSGSATYYSNTSGSLSELTTWGSNPSGTGSNPPSFNTNGIQLIVSNRTSTNLGGSLTLQGAVSRVIVPSGITLNVDNVLNAKVEVEANGVLNLNYAQQQPDLVELAAGSTVNYNYISDAVFIKQATYGNLGLAGVGAKTFTAGTTTILGNLNVAQGISLKGSIGNQTVINIAGNLAFTGTPASTPRDFGVTLNMTANGPQTITTGGTLDLFQIIKTGTGTVNLVNSGTPITLNLGSNVGGGLSIPAGRVFNIANNTLALGGSARINGAGETGVLGVNGGSINLTSSSNSGSNLRFNPAANTISRLTVNLSGSGFANFYSAAKVTDAIKVTRGTLNPNGHLTLISTETQTANIERIENNGVITSSVRVQRFIDPKGRNYRYISSSVAGVTVANWQTYFDITGLFTGANTGGALSSNPSLFTFNGTDYVAYPTAANTEPIERGVGYALFNRNGTNPTLMETTGIPYQGTVPFALVPNAGANSEAGWNLLGNPYASTIVWSMDNTAWPRTGMNTTVTVRENDGAVTQVYVWDALTSSGNLPGGRIAPGQAFWVQSMAAGASLSITEMAKSTGQQTHFREGADLISKLRINVSKGEKSDPAFIALTTVGTDKFDPEFDAVKQPNVGIFNFSTFSGDDNVALAINNSSDAFCSKTVKLNLRDVTPGTYTLSTENPETLFGVGAIILVDHFTNTTLDLRNTTSYSFDVTSDIKSFGKDRFELVMHRPELDLSLQHTTAQVCGEAAPVTLETTQAGALYSIVNEKGEALSEVLTATGDALTLTVPKEMLRDGKNTFKVQTQFKGCTAAMLQSPVVVEYTTPPVANVAEFVSVCAGAPAVINVQHPDTGVSYKWYNGYQQSIAGVSSNTFITSAVTMDTIYYVAAVSGKGCEGPKQMVIVTPEILEVPAVIPAGDTLYASASQGVQWFKNGESIFNATQPYYVPSTTGSYSVQVTKGGCIANSDEYVVNIESMVFPNPTSSANINFKFIADSDGNMKVSIVDLMGKKVHEDVFSAYDLAGGVKISPATKLNSGVYFLVVERNGFIRKVKFVLNE